MSQVFDIKDPAETITLTFDMSLGLATGETLTGTPTIEGPFVVTGSDSNPSAILVGANTITSTTVLVPVKGGVNGTDYFINAVCSTSNPYKTLALPAILPVRSG